AVMPLLRGKYQIERFVLDSPKVQLIRAADGFNNWEDLLSAQPVAVGSAAVPQSSVAGVATSDSQASPTASSVQGGSILAALSAQSLRMSDGEVHYTDAISGQNTNLTALNIEVDDVQMLRPVSLRLSGKLEGDGVAVDGMLGPIGDIAAFDAAHFPVKAHVSVPAADLGKLARLASGIEGLGKGMLGLDVQLEQRPNGVRVLAGSVKLHLAGDAGEGDTAPTADHDIALDVKAQMPDAKRMQIEQLVASLDGTQLADVNGTLTGIGGDMRYQMRVNTPELNRMQLSQWLPELQSMYAAHPAPWKTVKLGMLAAGNMDEVDIRDLQLQLNGELVQISGTVNYASGPNIRLRIASRLLHLDPWLPQPAPADQTAKSVAVLTPADGLVFIPEAHASDAASDANQAGASISSSSSSFSVASDEKKPAIEPDLRFLKSWKIAAVMQVDQLWLRGLDIGRLRADVNGKNGVININPLRFELAGGRIEEKASINVAVYPATWKESVKVRDVQIQPVLKALAANDMLSGSLQMETKLSGRGLLPQAAVSRLNGNGNVLLRDGSIKGFDIPGILRNLKNSGQGNPDTQKTDFSQLSGSFSIKNGVAKNDDLFVASPLFRLGGFGQVDLPASTMDYHLKPRLVGTLVGQGDSEAVRKGLEVPLRLSGPLNAPKVKLEVTLESLLGNREAIQEIVKDPKAALRNLLGGVLPGQPAPKPNTQPARIKPQAEPAQPNQPAQPTRQLENL
ncbi:MAG: AsmA family protein, partial [Mariprofundaceae bacterium]|nr:AsmA family protein [Mariprofundaceae bacterium]